MNFKMNETRDETQGGNWKTIGCTLFVSVIRFLCLPTWNSIPTFLSAGQAVSVIVKDGSNGLLHEYGEINSVLAEGDGEVLVYHPASPKIVSYPVDKIKIRLIITVPDIVVSEYKGHDSLSVKCYLDTVQLGPTGWLHTQTRYPGIFLHFITELKFKYGLVRVTWTFGAPRHGKGTWDGLGGICKSTAKRKIINDELSSKTAYEIFELLKLLFDENDKRQKYDKSRRTNIKRWRIAY